MSTALERIDQMLAGMDAQQTAELDKLLAVELSKPWLPTAGPQLEAFLSDADLLLYGGSAGGGKRLDNDTLVPVPVSVDRSGFKRHGDLAVGNIVYGGDGSEIAVLGVTAVVDAQDSFEVCFDTGETIIADGAHRWLTWDEAERLRHLRASPEWRANRRRLRPSRAVAISKKPGTSAAVSALNRDRIYDIAVPTGTVRTTAELASSVKVGARCNYSIDAVQPILSHASDLPIAPYLFGLWIGDGFSKAPSIGMDCRDWPDIEPHIPRWDSEYVDTRPPRKNAFIERRFSFMLPHLRNLGVWGAKRIPPVYLRASKADRIALLQGILDTDGTCSARGQIECGFSNQALAQDLHELISTLGIKVTIRRKTTKCQTGPGKDHFRVKFMASFPAFRLPRKLNSQKLDDFRPTVTRRYITDIRRVSPRQMRCIKVSAPDGLYCVTSSFIITHNTDLICGLALTEHERSVVFRRQANDLDGFWERLLQICPSPKHKDSNKKKLTTSDGRLVECGHLDLPGSELSWQGRPHDLICFDEGAQLTAYKVKFVLGWLRSATAKKCRAVIASNPPIGGEGSWLMEWFAPWLDPLFPNPAKHGELRWAIALGDSEQIRTVWVDGPASVEIEGKTYEPLSRTFIPSRLDDNPYLKDTNYRAHLNSMPEPLRSQLLHGDFLAGRQDDEWQVIPSAWVRAAQERWKGPPRTEMKALCADIAQGGPDKTSIACLHEPAHFAAIESRPGLETPDGPSVAALVLKLRRDSATIGLDTTGGWGGSARDHLKTHHQITAVPIVFSAAGIGKDKATQLEYHNLRAQMYWQFRTALDPDNGEEIALPPGARVLAQLTAAHWKPRSGKILIESKEEIKARLGVSPDEADAIVMAWHIRDRKVREAAKAKLPKPKVNLGQYGVSNTWMG